MNYFLFTIWALDEGTPEPWLVDAWDEFSIDGNEAGWLEAIEKARASSSEVRIIKVLVSQEDIANAFKPAVAEGEVQK